MKYLRKEILLDEYLKSKSQGKWTDDFENNIDFLLTLILSKLQYSLVVDKNLFMWYIKRYMKQNEQWWNNYNPNLNPNPIPYFTEISKRLIAKTYKDIEKVKSEYYYYEIIKQRNKKIQKINQIYGN